MTGSATLGRSLSVGDEDSWSAGEDISGAGAASVLGASGSMGVRAAEERGFSSSFFRSLHTIDRPKVSD